MGKAEPNDAKRLEIYTEMDHILRHDGGPIIPYFPNFVYARRKNVKHRGQLVDGRCPRGSALVV